MHLFKLGFIDKNADFSSVICQNRRKIFRSIVPLQSFADDWSDRFFHDEELDYDTRKRKALETRKELIDRYARLLPKEFHQVIARIKKASKGLEQQYGYAGIFLNSTTMPIPLECMIEHASKCVSFPYRGEDDTVIDSKAIKVYDWKKYSLNKYNYSGDVLLSIDFSKTNETILNDIKLLISQVRGVPMLETVFVDSEEREIKDKTKTKLSFKDYKTRLLGLWLVDYKYLHECGGSPAIEALRETGYLERCGIKDNERALMRLIAATERCIAAADVLPITSTH